MSADEKQFRSALGRFATGVCVVSAINADGFPIGMTINSFSSVSLAPSLIQWSIKSKSISYLLFSDLPAYCISVLSERQLDISKRYAKAGDHIMQPDDYLVSASGVPFIRDSIAQFECRNWQIYQAGDHDLIVAAVENFSSDPQEEPLVFYKGGYRSLIAG